MDVVVETTVRVEVRTTVAESVMVDVETLTPLVVVMALMVNMRVTGITEVTVDVLVRRTIFELVSIIFRVVVIVRTVVINAVWRKTLITVEVEKSVKKQVWVELLHSVIVIVMAGRGQQFRQAHGAAMSGICAWARRTNMASINSASNQKVLPTVLLCIV